MIKVDKFELGIAIGTITKAVPVNVPVTRLIFVSKKEHKILLSLGRMAREKAAVGVPNSLFLYFCVNNPLVQLIWSRP